MVKRDELLAYLDDFLDVSAFRDYSPNGLQVSGTSEIKRVFAAVTASKEAIDEAVAWQADAILVHHGYFWKGEDPRVIGMKRDRLATLLRHDINLLAYHLPLDQHPDLGNNRLFGDMLGASNMYQSVVEPLIWHGECAPRSLEAIVGHVQAKMASETFYYVKAPNNDEITRIAWCTGAAHDFLVQAAAEGAQLFISGEYAERTFHEARESDCHFIGCGHHVSERAGIDALRQTLEKEFSLETTFFDDKNPF
ncbi:Nif3-like dinuclear metal center hexameric protein [Suttonella sp. R2A3]|uniref:Nif3-like dinuclear metal center hexameric protein n=1 Tax=Suttonella sp. R2A3 TaxID=2908648 RepID=UPI001F00A45D|nr:Nif3-like dinuclear metal center hexameric protein [Suttonella sp. R2A3]UJF24563.1 Nif3-like dinuclear metal center hexameric protein [Suttonella sp. R2A3]